MLKKIKTLVVDDSIIVRHVLSEILTSDPTIELIDAVVDPIFALEVMEKQKPDVIILDIEMPRMDGLTFLRKIMQENPIPVIMCSSLTEKGAQITVEALASGALDIITKPKAGLKGFLSESRVALLEAVKAAAQADLKTLRMTAELARSIEDPLHHSGDPDSLKTHVIAIGAATGGVQALELILSNMPLKSPGIVVVQHMSSEFTPAFAKHLNKRVQLEVREAEHNDVVTPGTVLLAPGNRHMTIKEQNGQYVVELKNGPVIKRHRPSIDVLLRTVAQSAKSNAIGVILTGMGDDGVIGLNEISKSGGYTIAQDESTSVVYRLPQAAQQNNPSHHILPLEEIAPAMMRYLG